MARLKHGFSLVELVVVITIIAVLSVIAVPAISKIRARSQAVKCLSNLRQLGVALNGYLAEHNQQMPTMAAGRADKSEEIPTVDTVLIHYARDAAVFRCPSDPDLWAKTGTSYYWNNALNGQRTMSLNFLDLTESASRIPVLGDKEGWHRGGDSKVNILYADGHADNGLQLVTGN